MPSSSHTRVLWYLIWLAVVDGVYGNDDTVDGLVSGSVHQVDLMVSQVVEHHFAGCHLVLATTKNKDTLLPSIHRHLAAGGQASVAVEVDSLFSQEPPTQDRLLQGVWGGPEMTCRAILLHVGEDMDDANLLFRFVEASGLWMWPETRVVLVGEEGVVANITDHVSLRNTINVLLFTFHLTRPASSVTTGLRKREFQRGGGERVKVKRRCLYCNKGQLGVRTLQQTKMSSDVQWDDVLLLPEKLRNFSGHRFRVVTLVYFPFISFEKNTLDPHGPVTPLDSLDIRILNAIATLLNFTYEMREPWDGTWGVPLTGGNWSGIVGTLQHQEADFSLNLTPTPARMEVMTHSRIYSYDPMIIVSLKPRPLPRRLALIRPFAGGLWTSIFGCTLVAGVILWLLQKGWSWVSGQRGLSLDSSLLYTWGALLEDQPSERPSNISGQVLVGWWLLSCLVIDTAYRSSLIAHLTVQSKFPPINGFEDILQRDGLSWGSTYLWGTLFIYYNQSTDPIVQEIYKHMETYELMDGIQRVLEGGFAFIVSSLYTKTAIASLYHNRHDNMPLYLSSTEYSIFGGNSWGFRQGAPCVGPIRRLKQRLVEAGLIDRWLDEVIENDGRNKRADGGGTADTVHFEVNEKQAVLGLDHLQGVFYFLPLGYTIGLFTLFGENVFHLLIQ